jgi:hypothetical protein
VSIQGSQDQLRELLRQTQREEQDIENELLRVKNIQNSRGEQLKKKENELQRLVDIRKSEYAKAKNALFHGVGAADLQVEHSKQEARLQEEEKIKTVIVQMKKDFDEGNKRLTTIESQFQSARDERLRIEKLLEIRAHEARIQKENQEEIQIEELLRTRKE